MKKISLYAAGLLAMGLGFTACDNDKLTLEPPTNYVMETPADANQLITLSANYKLDVTTINPYNINTVVDFQVQVARSEADFTEWDDKVSAQIGSGNDDGNYDFTNAEGLPLVVTLNGTYTTNAFSVPGLALAEGINELLGLDESNIDKPVSVAMRTHAWIPGVEYSSIFSNVVMLSQVQSYIVNESDIPAAPKGRALWLVGQPQGWNINESNMWVEETVEGSNIYSGNFYIEAGKFQFRFYSELGDWDAYSIGAQDEDNPVNITFTDGVYSGDVVVYNEAEGILGKGSWQDSSWSGGNVEVVIDLNDNTITMTVTEGNTGGGGDEGDTGGEDEENPAVIYIIGACQGWNINGDTMALNETEVGSKIYTGSYEIAADEFTFRFYTALGDWEAHSIGSLESGADEDMDIDFPFEGPLYDGKGKFHVPDWPGGNVNITVDLNEMQVSFE